MNVVIAPGDALFALHVPLVKTGMQGAMRRAVAVCAIALAFVLSLGATARADDAGLFAAYTEQHAKLDDAVDRYVRWRKYSDRHLKSRRALRGAIRADKRINAVLRSIAYRLSRQRASSVLGKRAKAHAVNEVTWWAFANRLEMQALQAWLDGDRRKWRHLISRAENRMRIVYREGWDAVAAFKRIGFHPDAGPLSN
jgi:hypothetical protein